MIFWLYSPKYSPILPKLSPMVVFQEIKTLFENILKGSSFYRKGIHPNLALWTLNSALNPVSLWRWPKSKKTSSIAEKLQPLDYPNMSKSKVYLLPPFRERYDYFLQYFPRNRPGFRINFRIKIWQVLFHPHGSWSNFCKRNLTPTFSTFTGYIDHKGNFQKILTRIFRFGCFSWYHVYIFEKKIFI